MPTRTIKKYPNRRLYDTERSCYITIDDVRDLVLKGIDFTVIDAQTEQDITRSILIQIITEHESGKKATFTTEMLARFIRLSHDAARDAFSDYLDQSMRVFVEQQQMLRRQVEETLSGKTLAEMTQRNLDLWRGLQQSFLDTVSGGAGSKKVRPRSGKRAK